MDLMTVLGFLLGVSVLNSSLILIVKMLVDSAKSDMQAHVKKMADEIEAEFVSRDVRHEKLEGDIKHGLRRVNDSLETITTNMPREFVRRDDWVMSFSRQEQRMDSIWEFLNELKTQIFTRPQP